MKIPTNKPVCYFLPRAEEYARNYLRAMNNVMFVPCPELVTTGGGNWMRDIPFVLRTDGFYRDDFDPQQDPICRILIDTPPPPLRQLSDADKAYYGSVGH